MGKTKAQLDEMMRSHEKEVKKQMKAFRKLGPDRAQRKIKRENDAFILWSLFFFTLGFLTHYIL